MQCREFEQRLNDRLDQRGDPAADPRLRAHAQTCASCQSLLAAQQLLLAGLRWSSAPALGRDFSQRVLAAADSSAAVTRPRRAARAYLAAGTLLASAAAALLAVSLVWYARSSTPEAGTPEAGASAKRGTVVLAKKGAARSRGASGGTLAMTRAGSSHVNWPQRDWSGRDWLVEAPRLPDHLRESLDDLADTIPESVQRYGEVERMAPGIRPLRLSLALLWDTLFRALPGVSSETPHPEPNARQPNGRSTLATVEFKKLA